MADDNLTVELPLASIVPIATAAGISIEELVRILFHRAVGLFGQRIIWYDGLTNNEVAVCNELDFKNFGEVTIFPIASPSNTGISRIESSGKFLFRNPARAICRNIGTRYRGVKPTQLARDIVMTTLHIIVTNATCSAPSGCYLVRRTDAFRLDLL